MIFEVFDDILPKTCKAFLEIVRSNKDEHTYIGGTAPTHPNPSP